MGPPPKPAKLPEITQYFNGKTHKANFGLIEKRLKGKSVILYGNSVDGNALVWACREGGVPREKLVRMIPADSNGVCKNGRTSCPPYFCSGCTVAGLNLTKCRFEGTGEPPYWRPRRWPDIPGVLDDNRDPHHVRSLQIPSERRIRVGGPALVQDYFKSDPTMVVLDANLWDLAGFWLLHGEPKSSHVDVEDMEWLCNVGIPEALGWIKETFPNTIVAYQVPPTLTAEQGGRSPAVVDQLAACTKARLTGTGYVLIDFQQIVRNQLAKNPKGVVFKDATHPHEWASMEYVNLILSAMAKEGGL